MMSKSQIVKGANQNQSGNNFYNLTQYLSKELVGNLLLSLLELNSRCVVKHCFPFKTCMADI